MRRPKSLIPVALCLLAWCGLVGCGGKEKPAPGTGGELTVLCAGGVRPPIETIREQFEEERGCTVRVTYAGSGDLVGQLKTGIPADLFIPGDMWYVEQVQGQGLVESSRVLAWFVPVIGVQKGNPKGIKGLADLARSDVRVGLGRANACAVGQTSQTVLAASGLAGRVKPEFEAVTVNALADQLKLKALDAAIIWDAIAKLYAPDVEQVAIDDGDFHAVPFGVAVLKTTKDRALAAAFVETAAGSAGAKAFRDFHYQVPGPTLDVRCGGTMSGPIRELAQMFQQQTGRQVRTTFGDSGTLLLETSEAKEGDIYVCHDPYALLAQERGMTKRWYAVGYLKPVIAVAKGNPKNVKGLKDLLRPDLKVGMPHRQFSTCGQIIWAALRKHALYDQMDQRKPFESRSSGDLGNQLKLGALDAVVMWDAVAKGLPDAVDIVAIEPEFKVDAITSATTTKTFDVREIKVTVVTLVFAKEPLLAAQFAKLATSPAGAAVWARHGFQVTGAP